MNDLPEHRRVIEARTHARMYRHADYAGIEHYRAAVSRGERIAGWLLAAAIGVGLAAWLVVWWSA